MKTLMVRSAFRHVSNHEAPISASSFETPLARLLRMRKAGGRGRKLFGKKLERKATVAPCDYLAIRQRNSTAAAPTTAAMTCVIKPPPSARRAI